MKTIFQKIMVLLSVLLLFSSCQGCGGTYDFIKATEPEDNKESDTYANFFYNDNDNTIQCVAVKLKRLKIEIRDDGIKKTSLKINNNYLSDSVYNYTLLVTSELELKEWKRWVEKYTVPKPSFEPGIVYPPDYVPKNPDKPEKE